jgi:hypothetical protein
LLHRSRGEFASESIVVVVKKSIKKPTPKTDNFIIIDCRRQEKREKILDKSEISDPPATSELQPAIHQPSGIR